MKVYSKINYSFISIFLLTSYLFSANGDDITTAVTNNGSYQKTGYMNSHTTGFTFTVTISGADQTTYSSGEYLSYVIFNSGAATVINGVSSWTVLDANPTSASFTVTDDNLEASTGWPGDGGTVDFQVRFRDSDAANSIYDDVTLAGSATELNIDQTFSNWGIQDPGTSEYTKDSDYRIYVNESVDSAHVNWAGDDGSSQSEVISQSINASGYTTITGGITLTEGVTYTVTSQLFDNAHNRAADANSNVGVDLTNPSISSLSSSETAGTYKIGDNIAFKISFDDYVIPVSGSLTATFNTTNTATATTSSDNWSVSSSYATEWSGSYTVQEGDDVANLSVTQVTMSSGTLYDKTYSTSLINTANSLSMPVSSFTTNIEDGVSLEIDGVRPTISSVTSSSPDASYSEGETINITVNFSETVTLNTGDLQITLETGDTDNTLTIAASDIVSTTTAVGTYTVNAGDVSSDLSVDGITVTGGGTLSDAAGNAMSSFAVATDLSNGHAIVLETTAPVIGSIINNNTSDGTYGIGSDIGIKINIINGIGGAAENVTLSAGSLDITLETGDSDGTASNGSISSESSIVFTYTVEEGHSSSDLSVSTVAVTGGSITDAAGNALDAAPSIPAGGNLDDASDIVIEATRPTITAVTSTTADGTYKAGDDINITMQFDESVTLSGGTLDLIFDFEGTDQTLNVSTFTNSNSATATYTVQEGDTTSDLTIGSIALGSGASLTDVVENNPNALTNFTPATTLASAHAIAIDGILPTITKVTSSDNDGSYSVGETVNVTVSFYEPVTLSGGNLVVTLETGGTDQTVTISSISSALTASGTYTVQSDDASSDLEVKTIALSAGTLSDAAGNAMTDFSVPTGKNISDFKDIVIDGTVPADFQTGAVTTVASVSTFVVTGYWNEMNTNVDITIPLASDNSLVGGTVQVRAKIDANSYVDVGAAETIQSSDVTAGTIDVRIDQSGSGNTDIEELTSFANGGVITFNAILTDLAGNSTTGTASTTTLTIDTTAATVSSVTSSTNDGIYKTGDDIAVDITFDDNITLTGGTLDITMESGSVDNSVSISTITSSNSETATYTVQSGDSNADLYVKSLAVSGGYLIDIAGNPMSTADLTISAGNNISDSKDIEIDGIDPSAFTVGSVTTTGGNVYTGYWNSTNTGFDVIVPIDDDASLTDGTVQIRGKVDSESYENVGSAVTIAVGDLDNNKTISITEAELEALTNFADDGIVTITAIITDEAGNTATGTESATTLTIDQTDPSSFTASTVSPDGNVESAGYFNGVNTGIEVIIPLEGSDNSLSGGKIRLQAKAGGNPWENVADFNTVLGSDFTAGFKTVSVDSGGTDSTDIVELIGFAENENLYFRAILWDIAGNQRTGTQSATNMVVDQVQPTVSSVSSSSDNGSYKSGTTINIDVIGTEVLNVTATPQITLETGTTDATVDYTSGSTTTSLTFVYTVDDGHTSSDLDVQNVNALSLNSGTIYDNAGNALDLTLPTPGASGSLGDNKDIIVDTEDPTAVITYSDSLVKENDIITITTTFSEEMSNTPQVAILYAGATELDTTNMSNVNDTVWVYNTITIPDGNDGAATVSIIANDIAGNSLTNGNTTNRTLLRVDNTHPTFTLLSPDSGEYVNHTLIGYKLNETSFSGSVTWTRVGGEVDANSPHVSSLTVEELDQATTFSDYTLTNVPTNLVSGTNYQMMWSATDSAGNVSADFIETPVFYDSTAPTAALTYSHYYASVDTVVTITATFNERALPIPQISIDYAGVGDDISATNMTMGSDSTIWTYPATIPSGEGNNGIASVTITATDLASNTLRSADIANSDTLIVDNTLPTISLSYSNLTQTNLSNEGKYQDIVEITAQFSEKANTTIPPVLNVEYSDSTSDSFTGMSAFNSDNSDSTWIYQVTLPDSSKNDGIFTTSLTAKDLAGNFVTTITNNQVFTVDNTKPASFLTGTITVQGTNQVTGWYNSTMDSVEILVPIPAPGSDNTILGGGKLDIQIFNIVRGSDWVTILSQDSIEGSGSSVSYFRTKAEIESFLIPETSLIQGDTLIIRAAITDRVGNTTYGDSSLSRLVYDPFAPNLGAVTAGIFFTQDTIVSSDSISATWSEFTDSVFQSIPGSGLSSYDYKIQHYNATGTYVDDLQDWTSLGTSDNVAHTDLALTHDNQYSIHVRATDVAGNISDIMNSDTIRRINSAPIITFVTDTVQSFEDILFSQTIQFTDADTATISGDAFTYELTTTHQYGHTPATPAAFLTGQNVINWTPTQSDTGLYTAEVIVNDNWTFSDTISYPLLVIAVNDTPTVVVLTPNKNQTMQEDQTTKVKFLLSQYGNDVDNDSTQLTYQVAVLDTSSKPGFPNAKLFFGNGTPEIVKQRLFNMFNHKPIRSVSHSIKDNKELSKEIITVERKMLNFQSSKSMANYIQVDLTDTTGIWWAEFNVDSNYYGSNHRIIFFVSDPAGATGLDTVYLTITPENDPPQIATIPLIEITENQFKKMDFADYVTDVDDTTLTIRVAALTNNNKMAITTVVNGATTIGDSLQYLTSNVGDSVLFTPEKLWSDTSLIQISVIDAQNARASKTFVIDILRVPRPNISLEVIQNNAFTNFFEVILTDTVSKTDSLFITVQGQPITLDTVASYTYVGHYSFDNPGTYSFYVKAWGVVGDTTITRSVNMALAKAFYDWTGYSPDGNFRVYGSSGSVPFDQSLLIVDSTMFNQFFHDRASYRLGKELSVFELPVEISISSISEDFAIYQRRNGVEWIELPSISEYGQIIAYTDGMGYFRLGPKTLIVPGETSLHQNYPNPFNPVTNIIYDVGFSDGPQQRVNVVVYNLLGQHVRTLVNEQKDIGRYTIRWDGRDKNGIGVSSGIYFVRMMNNYGRIHTRKMMLLR